MKYFLISLFIFAGPLQIFSQAEPVISLRGVVKDAGGSPVSGAEIQIVTDSGEIYNCNSDREGAFTCPIKKNNEKFTLTVRADGFSILRRTLPISQDISEELEFLLDPAALRETVVISTSRTESLLSETPASVATVSKEQINITAAPAADDILRQTVGFSLFRRSNSRTANPTTQGTSLRGINASGASRSKILFGGVPLNDAFGGWVKWSRVPPIGIEQIEVLRGGSSSLYGSDSLGGTINIIPRKSPEKNSYFLAAELFGGTQKTISGSIFFGLNIRKWAFDLTASNYQTNGYRPIDKDVRGAVDDPQNSHNSNYSARISRKFAAGSNLFVGASYFGEARNNGTPVQKNRTHLRQFSGGADLDISKAVSRLSGTLSNSRLIFRGYGGTQVFDQTFSAVSDDRSTENLVRLQRVPVQSLGANVQFSTVYRGQTLLGGFEISEVRGASNEIGYFGGNATSAIGAGGRERSYGIYFQDFAKIGERLVLVGNLRLDLWKNSRALSSTLRFSNDQISTRIFPDRAETAISPGVSILYRAAPQISFYMSASRNFRAPTLNELYRGFRVGDVVTDPNENLRAEKANNFEGGISYGAAGFYLRGNFYWTEVLDAISNVTVSSTPALITRTRQNTGKIRVRGLEIEAEKRFGDVDLSIGYLFVNAVFAEFPENKAIENLKIPQVPVHQITFQTHYRPGGGWDLSLQGRGSSSQFDNDLNTLRLEPYFQLDVFTAKRIGERWQIFAAVENIFDARYSTGKTPVRSVSAPATVRIGIRWN
ncbi:MAG: TonB-dependent receptor [Acidobacteria bacterium]|nr:TonB-dependent receptor [Acidobacteriota bacterium]